MKNCKKFYALGAYFYFHIFLFLFCFIALVLSIIEFASGNLFNSESMDLSKPIFAMLGAIFMCIFICFIQLRETIFFKSKYIHVLKDLDGRFSIQYETKVNYEDIADIKLIRSSKNSCGQSKGRPVSITLAFMEFTLKNGRKKRIVLSRHNKRQWVKIIDELKNRLKSVNNEIELPDTKEMIKNLPKADGVIFDKKI